MRKAIVYLGGLVVLKNPKFIESAIERDLEILIIDRKTERLLDCVNTYSNKQDHPFHNVKEFFLYNQEIEIFNKFESWMSEYKIMGLICFNEGMVNISGMLSKLFNLPGPGMFASTVCNDKLLQRQLLKEWSPQYIYVEPNKREFILKEIESFSFPVVCKPTGRSSSSGVVLIKDIEQLSSIINDYHVEETLLLEEYIKGKEFSVESLIHDGEVVFSGITEKTTNESKGDFFVEMGHLVPARNISKEEQDSLIEINNQIVNLLNFENGISHAEYKIDERGKVKLMEIAARPPGDAIIDLYSISLEYPFESLLLDVYTKTSIPSINHKKYAKQVYIEHPYGTLKNVKTNYTPVMWMYEFNYDKYKPLLSMRERKNIHLLIMYRVKEDILREIRSSHDRSGAFIISSEAFEELRLLETKVLNDIEVEVI